MDAGISCKQICLRLEQVQSHITDIDGIFITHEHSDHTRGLDVLLRKNPLPVYMTEKTYDRMHISIDPEYLRTFTANGRLTVDQTVIQSLPKSHDAVDPTLFCFHYRGKKISVITDAGHGCENVKEALRDAHIVFLESNYDDEMLRTGLYPPYLKKRIAGPDGHLSNVNAGSLIRDHASPALQYVFLAHLSENNNTPTLAMDTFQTIIKERKDLKKLNTILTSRYHVSEIVELETGKH
ncbi:MAG: MBL fold metallo-hydrolase [bacterium]|nr:MBL fold metallo-hydrolase [bacterium]